MIKETKDYDMFKKHASNRVTIPDNITKIMKSIMVKNLLEYRPILVDEEYYVIDGQHRLEAAKKLGVSIWYQIEKKSDVSDMFLLNANQRKWYPEDYLNFYCSEGNQNYIKFREFMKKHNLILASALKLISKYGQRALKHYGALFNEGKFIFPEKDKIFEAEEVLEKVERVIEFLAIKLSGTKHFIKTTKFMMAILEFLILYPVDFDDFMKKLNFKLEIIHPCSQKAQYVKIFIQIYNFRNHNPLVEE